MTKSLAVALGVVALIAGTVAGTVLTTLAVTSGPRTPSPSSDLRLASATLRPATSCEDLLARYVERGVAEVGPYGWDTGPIIMFDAMGSARSESAAGAPLPRTTGSSSTDSGTNVQEAGVDEPDVVKAAGDLLVRVRDDVLTVHDVSGADVPGAAPRLLSSLTLTGLRDGELLVSGDRVVVLGAAEDSAGRSSAGAAAEIPYDGYGAPPRTRVVVLDVSDPGTPRVVDTADYDAELTAARLHTGQGDTGQGDDVVRLVLRTYRPALDFAQPEPGRGQQAALEHNRRVVRETTLADWLPTSDGEQVVDCADVAVPTDDDAALGTTTVVALRPTDPDPLDSPASTAVAADAATSYFSPDRFYLATTATPGWWTAGEPACLDRCVPGSTGGGFGDGTTDLYAFALDGIATTFVAGGQVTGTVRDRWAMDFSGDTLRVAVGTTDRTAGSNTLPANAVITLREDEGGLDEVGRVDGLGVGEDIKAVRWFDDLAIVVTFRQVDPLYAVDLTDPGAPRLLGELKVPGYSDYLHPLGGRRLLGIGQDASADGSLRGAQAALFDVTDLTAPQRLDAVAYPPFSVAGAGTDPRQLTWLPEQRVALAVVSRGWSGGTAWVSVLRLGADRIRNEMVEVDVQDELADVRLVPLADGRVVLVAGDAVSFFDL
ncbi:beta-propeller domain-containing protein [Nocardioides sp. Soil805]|uniref:beta-propeller domain-containing protein n=1 Tax=Nocardioides sp. Soil805 TaxID=1736416 RepID=UPI0007030AC3|nr:beta-propeller domain-containing protein [Nocardioides sp. Soil805]KRF37037.1 hypothetical protein ASG94_06565 [Nocardioides sp. Soil805]